MEKSQNNWRLKNTRPNNIWVKEELSRETKKYFVLNENENITYQNLYAAEKVVLTGKFIAI